jgi:hypothetical protein
MFIKPEIAYVPPYRINDAIIKLISEISELIGAVTVKDKTTTNPDLRRNNQILCIH